MVVFDCNKVNLKKNSTGDQVKTLQTHLKNLGFYNSSIDGSFGEVTETAVINFQKKYSLGVDGVFGKESCSKLNAVVDASKTTSNTTPVKLLDCKTVELRQNSKGGDVKILQTMLKTLGYYKSSIDGDFGGVTDSAVRAFQKATGHDPDGWVGSKTCPDLNRLYTAKVGGTTASSTAKPVEKDDTPFYRRVFTGTLTIYPDRVVLPEDMTVSGNKSGDDDGSVKVAKANSTVASANNVTFDCSTVNLQKNSKGAQVTQLQTLLKSLGYYTRQIDGDFGPYTEEAVKKLQRQNGNDPDGWFGPKTCAKLNASKISGSTAGKDKKTITVNTIVSSDPSVDGEGLTTEMNIKIPYTTETLSNISRKQKAKYTIKHGKITLAEYTGYISSVKLTQEDGVMLIEAGFVNYIAFLEQTIEFEGSGKRSDLIKQICDVVGIKCVLEFTGLKNDEYEIKAQTQETEENTDTETDDTDTE